MTDINLTASVDQCLNAHIKLCTKYGEIAFKMDQLMADFQEFARIDQDLMRHLLGLKHQELVASGSAGLVGLLNETPEQTPVDLFANEV